MPQGGSEHPRCFGGAGVYSELHETPGYEDGGSRTNFVSPVVSMLKGVPLP